MNEIKRLVCLSNRLPIVLQRKGEQWTAQPGSGGLVAALEPVFRNRGGKWIGWPGAELDPDLSGVLASTSEDAGYELCPVPLTAEEEHGFYYGFSNEILWPLFHGLPTRCNFDPSYWQSYESANRKFADTTLACTDEHDFIWIHDYHLMLVATHLRQARNASKLAFFLHIPFPAPETFLKLPWRAKVLEGLLSHDLIGFHTLQDRNNFLQCLRRVRLKDLKVEGRGAGTVVRIRWRDREVRVGAFPISIDYDGIQKQVTNHKLAHASSKFHEQFSHRKLIIGMDRLDYTKGIPQRLEAFRLALIRYPELRGKVSLFQAIVPSREQVPEYDKLLSEIERLVGSINGEFTIPGQWVPIHYLHRSLPRSEALAYMRAADVALVTPLRDGMNLVAKEYCACAVGGDGVLILSEFAGAASELKNGALLVNPNDLEAMAAAIHEACIMPERERRKRMARLCAQVKGHNIYHWVSSILEAAFVPQLDHFPLLEEYVPDLEVEVAV